MARIKFQGLEEYEKLLSKISSPTATREIAGAAIYAGAEVVADAIKKSIEALPVVEDDLQRHGSARHMLTTITKKQKDGLLEGFGITQMREESGYYNVKLGFDGYNKVKTKQYPAGQPNALIARSINSGTSFRAKTQFVDLATKESKPQAEKAMAKAFDKKLEEQMK